VAVNPAVGGIRVLPWEQRELVKKLRVNKNSVYEWENDRKKPSKESMEKLAKFFRISKRMLEDFMMDRERDI
jgi:transcriptional regulator with XRE-family HTH domain